MPVVVVGLVDVVEEEAVTGCGLGVVVLLDPPHEASASAAMTGRQALMRCLSATRAQDPSLEIPTGGVRVSARAWTRKLIIIAPPIDTMPLTPTAKWLMSAQALTAPVTIGLVVARAVNILS